ncbi:MAG: flagellar biosynthesis anti-sigma factor FlgM [Acidobacteria bacterium]|nr:flagellar biosynthesis anti-sigma factor FlgM [Acidobacteriota bacterium]
MERGKNSTPPTDNGSSPRGPARRRKAIKKIKRAVKENKYFISAEKIAEKIIEKYFLTSQTDEGKTK